MTLQRIGVIGDIHCEDVSLALAVGRLRDFEVDVIWCVGDIVDGKGDPNRTCELLRGDDIVCVAGNHERWLLAGDMRSLDDVTNRDDLTEEHLAWLATLAPTHHASTEAGAALLCHGIGEDDMAVLRPETRGYGLQALDSLRALMLDPDVQFMVGGHTHQRMVRRFQGLTVINPGTLHRDFDPGFVLVDFAAMQVLCFDVGTGSDPTETLALPPPAPIP